MVNSKRLRSAGPIDPDHGRLSSGAHVGSHMAPEDIPGAVVHREDHQRGRNWREYWWYVDEHLAPESHHGGPGHVCWLHDMADIRNHRHHGLIGALIRATSRRLPSERQRGQPDGMGSMPSCASAQR